MPADRLPVAHADSVVSSARPATHFPELESLRGIAILLVFFFHADGVLTPPHGGIVEPLWLAFLRAGHVGVDLFFILSGFLLGRPFLAAAASGRMPSLRRYAQRRTLRILPLYWVAVLVATLLVARNWEDLRHGIPYLFFLNSFAGGAQPMFPFSIPWWSLATEVQFYVVLPLLPLLLMSRRGRIIGVGLLAAYAVAFVGLDRGWWRMQSIDGYVLLHASVFGCGPLFLLGISAAALHLHYGEAIRARLASIPWMRAGGADALLVATWVGIAYVLQWAAFLGFPEAERASNHFYHTVAGILLTAVLLALLLAPLRLKALWSNRLLGTVGVLSYSLYLVHVPILSAALKPPNGAASSGWTPAHMAAVIGLLLLCLGISAITYRLIERPFLSQKQRLGSADGDATPLPATRDAQTAQPGAPGPRRSLN